MRKLHIYPSDRKKTFIRTFLPLLLVVVIFAGFIYGLQSTSGSATGERQEILERAIKKAVIHCYALEGFYPQDISYLEEHYGVLIDHKRFIVFYETMGTNVFPDFRVVPNEAYTEAQNG